MGRHVLMLRGINLGPRRRIPMAELRALLADAGHEQVTTYLQSGNVVLSSNAASSELEVSVAALIADRFGFEVPVVGRGAHELAAVLERDPLGEVADDPKRYQVSFLAEPIPDPVRAQLEAVRDGAERLAFDRREIYAWHPHGIARSKLWNALAGPGLGVTATARNWSTVNALARLVG
jgi:uncharacterized protein (DUF1697 family)